jgi:hypothetical protein
MGKVSSVSLRGQLQISPCQAIYQHVAKGVSALQYDRDAPDLLRSKLLRLPHLKAMSVDCPETRPSRSTLLAQA